MSNRLFNDEDFDRTFENHSKWMRKGIAAVCIAWIIGAIVSLCLIGGLVYVIIHFLGKIW